MPINNDPGDPEDNLAGRGGPMAYHGRGSTWGAGVLLALIIIVLPLWWT